MRVCAYGTATALFAWRAMSGAPYGVVEPPKSALPHGAVPRDSGVPARYALPRGPQATRSRLRTATIMDVHSAKVKGMPATNPRVKPILAAHPDQLVVICVAGCDGKPKAVQILPRPIAGRAAEYVPSAATRAGASTGRRSLAAPRASTRRRRHLRGGLHGPPGSGHAAHFRTARAARRQGRAEGGEGQEKHPRRQRTLRPLPAEACKAERRQGPMSLRTSSYDETL